MLKIGQVTITVVAFSCFAIRAFYGISPVVYLHYCADARAPITYFFNENNNIVKDRIRPGESIEFRTAYRPHGDYYIDVSLPTSSQDGVEIKAPFSRVDVYIGIDARVTHTVIQTDFLARFTQ